MDLTLKLTEERKIIKQSVINNVDKNKEIIKLNRAIQNSCKRDKNDYYASICSEIERHVNQNHVKDLFLKIKQITRQFSASQWMVKNENGEDVTEVDKILDLESLLRKLV